MGNLLSLYLCKVKHNNGFDVMAYTAPECVTPVAQWEWYYSNKPTRRNRYVMFNGYRWKAVWVN